MYKEILSFQPLLNPNVISLVSQLQEEKLTIEQFHNKKAYCKKTNNLIKTIELTTAWEIYKWMDK